MGSGDWLMDEWFIVHDGHDYRDETNHRHIIGPFGSSSDAYSFHACEMGIRQGTAFIVQKKDLPVTETFTRYEYFDFVCRDCGRGYMKGQGINTDRLRYIDGDPIVSEPMCKPCKLSEVKKIQKFYQDYDWDIDISQSTIDKILKHCADLVEQVESGSYFEEMITS